MLLISVTGENIYEDRTWDRSYRIELSRLGIDLDHVRLKPVH